MGFSPSDVVTWAASEHRVLWQSLGFTIDLSTDAGRVQYKNWMRYSQKRAWDTQHRRRNKLKPYVNTVPSDIRGWILDARARAMQRQRMFEAYVEKKPELAAALLNQQEQASTATQAGDDPIVRMLADLNETFCKQAAKRRADKPKAK